MNLPRLFIIALIMFVLFQYVLPKMSLHMEMFDSINPRFGHWDLKQSQDFAKKNLCPNKCLNGYHVRNPALQNSSVPGYKFGYCKYHMDDGGVQTPNVCYVEE